MGALAQTGRPLAAAVGPRCSANDPYRQPGSRYQNDRCPVGWPSPAAGKSASAAAWRSWSHARSGCSDAESWRAHAARGSARVRRMCHRFDRGVPGRGHRVRVTGLGLPERQGYSATWRGQTGTRRSARTLVTATRSCCELGQSGTGQPPWAALMARKRRKTLVICRPCHEIIHHGQPAASAA